jgi:hypothetical protein
MKTNKDLLQFIFEQMEKLDTNKIDVDTAKAQSDLSKQANNAMRYELDRAKVLIKLAEHNALAIGEVIELRNVE